MSIDLQGLCNRESAMAARWGRDRAAAVAQRLQALDAVDRLGDMELLPYIRVVLSEKADQVIVGGDGVRIRLEVDLDRQGSGDVIAWKGCTSATIVGVGIEE